jgi:mannose-6-phosphate isomerase-like protein (cupin superfamily)
MPDYKLVNMMDVENMAAGRMPGMEARFARKTIESEHLGISFFRIDAEVRQPFGHRHQEQEEAYLILEGSGRLRLDDEIVEVKPWDLIRVAPQVVRAFESGSGGLAYIAVGNDRPEGGDAEMIQGFWSD